MNLKKKLAGKVGAIIEQQRKILGLSLQQVGELSGELGISIHGSLLSRYEKGICMPSFTRMATLDRILDTNITQLNELTYAQHISEVLAELHPREAAQRAVAAMRRADYPSALASYERAAEEQEEARLGIAESALKLGMVHRADEELEGLLSSKYRQPALRLWSQSLSTQNKPEMARVALFEAMHDANQAKDENAHAAATYALARNFLDEAIVQATTGLTPDAAQEANIFLIATQNHYKTLGETGRNGQLQADFALANALLGNKGAARLFLKNAKSRSVDPYYLHTVLSQIHAEQGEYDTAVEHATIAEFAARAYDRKVGAEGPFFPSDPARLHTGVTRMRCYAANGDTTMIRRAQRVIAPLIVRTSPKTVDTRIFYKLAGEEIL